jgi:hypothetical protein
MRTYPRKVVMKIDDLQSELEIRRNMVIRMPPWTRLCVPRSCSFLTHPHAASRLQFLRQISTAAQILPDDIYDIVIVGGGIAGLALTTSLRITQVSNNLTGSLIRHGQGPENSITGTKPLKIFEIDWAAWESM